MDDLIYISAQCEEIKVNDEIFISNETTSGNDFKMSLLASLYSQVEFLLAEIEEKNLLIRTLLIKESDVYNYTNNSEYPKVRLPKTNL